MARASTILFEAGDITEATRVCIVADAGGIDAIEDAIDAAKNRGTGEVRISNDKGHPIVYKFIQVKEDGE